MAASLLLAMLATMPAAAQSERPRLSLFDQSFDTARPIERSATHPRPSALARSAAAAHMPARLRDVRLALAPLLQRLMDGRGNPTRSTIRLGSRQSLPLFYDRAESQIPTFLTEANTTAFRRELRQQVDAQTPERGTLLERWLTACCGGALAIREVAADEATPSITLAVTTPRMQHRHVRLELAIDAIGRLVVVDVVDELSGVSASTQLAHIAAAKLLQTPGVETRLAPSGLSRLMEMAAVRRLLETRDLATARRIAASLSDAEANTPAVLLALMQAARASGDPVALLVLADRFVQQHPAHPGASLVLMSTGLPLGLFEEAGVAAERLSRSHPDDLHAATIAAVAALLRDDEAEARRWLAIPLEADPTRSPTHLVWLTGCLTAERNDLALDALLRYDRATKIDQSWLHCCEGYASFLTTTEGAYWRRHLGERFAAAEAGKSNETTRRRL